MFSSAVNEQMRELANMQATSQAIHSFVMEKYALLSFLQKEWEDAVGRYIDDLTADVITADGVKRNVIVINGQFPGPTLEVAEGSQVHT